VGEWFVADIQPDKRWAPTPPGAHFFVGVFSSSSHMGPSGNGRPGASGRSCPQAAPAVHSRATGLALADPSRAGSI
jgi:hypothetical protein